MRLDQCRKRKYSNSKALISVYGEGINESCQSLFFSLIAIISCRQTLDEKLLEKWRTPEICISGLCLYDPFYLQEENSETNEEDDDYTDEEKDDQNTNKT